jgi:cold shock CspA family protein
MRIKGVVKWYSDKKFGFLLTDEEHREVFFHVNDCSGFVPQEGLSVEFEMGLDKNGRQKAVNIKAYAGVGNGHHTK